MLLPRSIRLRITLWYVLTVALILGASGVFWYLSLERTLRAEIDDRLLVVVENLAGQVPTSPEGRAEFCTAVTQEPTLSGAGALVRFHDAQGLAWCDPLPGALPEADPRVLAAVAQLGQPRYQTLKGNDHSLRVLDHPLLVGGRVQGLIQVGVSEEPARRILDRLSLILLISIPLPLAALALGGWFLADRALAPVEEITQTISQINTDNLSRRLPPADEHNEIGRLVRNFNRMLAQLENSFRRMRQFAADASHELRTPLTVLRGETEVALRWGKNAEELRQVLASNLEEIDRMGRIIDDLLLLAKSEAGETPMNIKRVNLNQLVHELAAQGRILGENKGIAVTLELPQDTTFFCDGDELRLHQMLLNLVSNGIKYTPTGGRVALRLSKADGQAAISVSDTGVGMEAEHLQRIFDRFYRIDRNRSLESGAGLGLSIVKWIVEAHQGRIEVSSTLGEGSCFTVYLPLAAAEASA
ncbi:sensor histidine kinase [Geoalkalibacter halelectricus]|uniref:histidine kinase n=1 Tax=Geoalkalibacter halelectricus TaxID=2847045 RepID=A0ABY5ZMR6_9BACT|nr:ATP-binding protein [Geoalkalibacter halelectricus]MDO3378532.1 ATP-binding protein [Geoalkalibacter halelectricus]UWZ80154.1 ATP-binding protein [Geoalkalibacter halelectricus]